MKLLLSILALMILSGCYTQKKALRQTDKAYNNYRVPVAKFLREKVPCVTMAVDTAISTEEIQDSVVCPDQYITRIDTVYKDGKPIITTNTIKVAGGKVGYLRTVVTKTLTKTIRDSADAIIWADEKATLTKKYDKLSEKNEKLTESNDKLKKDKFKLILLLIAAGASIILILKFK